MFWSNNQIASVRGGKRREKLKEESVRRIKGNHPELKSVGFQTNSVHEKGSSGIFIVKFRRLQIERIFKELAKRKKEKQFLAWNGAFP